MKILQSLILALVLVLNFIFVSPALADRPKFQKNADYLEVTKAIEELAATPRKADGTVSEETTQKIAELEFLKYTLESGVYGGQCANNTGNILAVYGRDPDEDSDDKRSSYASDLYFLADGQTTESDWDCEGFYLPNNVTAATVDSQGISQQIQGGTAVKILDGTQLVVTANPDTGELEFKAPLAKVVDGKAVNWFVPNISQELVNSRVSNAPTNED